MIFEQKKIQSLYKKLISLYPGEFRKRFGESMEQTFNDLCNEHRKESHKIPLGIVIWMFAETSSGIVKENLDGANQMKHWLKTIGIAAFFSLLFTGTFFFLGLFFSDNPDVQPENLSFPFLDFIRSWLILTLIFTPIVSGLGSGESMTMKDRFIFLGGAILFGLLLTAPFAFMEYWNNPRIQSGEFQFPFLLFLGLLLLPTIFFLVATPIGRSVWAGESVLAHPISFVLRAMLLAFVAILWLNLIRDQMPCFLGGVPGCD